MSKFQVLEDIYRHAHDLTPAEFRVLVVLMTYTDENCTNAHPSNARLADEVGTDTANVRKRLKRLEELGYVVKTENGGNKYGHGKANVYRIQVPAQAVARAEELRAKRAGEAEGGQENPARGFSQPAKVGSHNPPSGHLPGHSSGPESSTVESTIQPSESFTVEAPLPPTQLPTKAKDEGPTTEWGRFHKHADYAAVLGAYTNAAYWKSQKEWDKAADAESVFWGHLYTLTDIEDIEFPVDQWSIRSTENTREGIGTQVRKILNSAADMKGEPLVWKRHGNLHNPHPVVGIRHAA